MKKISPCGLLCSECEYFENKCSGCRKIEGKVFWTEMMDKDCCPIYDCSVNEKEFSGCGSCSELPCGIFNKLRDPSLSNEEFNRSLDIRINRLRENKNG